MSKSTLIVCESPWTHDSGRLAPWSMRPFVEGLSELYDTRLVYRTFTSGPELQRLLSLETVDHPKGRFLVYIACHGNGGRLTLGRHDSWANLAPIATYMHPGVESVWIGACDLGGSRAIESFLKRGGAIWAGGYVCSVDWTASLLIDLSILATLLGRRALCAFSPSWHIGLDAKDQHVPLARALRVLARDRRQGTRPRDITPELLTDLRWNAG